MSVIGTGDTRTSIPPFRYTRVRKNTIRLFRFLPQSTAESLHLEMISDVSIDQEADDYFRSHYALSYCWGDQSLTEGILLNGCYFVITSNLFSALKTINNYHISDDVIGEDIILERKPRENFWLWSDAICINQQDIDEKNEQVQHMWRMYSGALRVLAWLGDESEHTSAAYDATKKYSALYWDDRLCPGDDRESHLCTSPYHPVLEPTEEAGLLDLTARPYFNRTWTIAEYAQSIHDGRGPVLLCGRFAFEPAMAYHLTATKTFRSRKDHAPFAKLHKNFGDGSVYHIAPLIFDSMLNSGCTNPQDRIFAMVAHPEVRSLNLGYARELKVDYRVRLHELVLIALEWYGRLMSYTEFEGYQPDGVGPDSRMYYASCMFIRVCKGLNCWQDDDTVERWFGRHRDLDISRLPQSITLASGQKVPCGDLLTVITYPIHRSTLDLEGTLSILDYLSL